MKTISSNFFTCLGDKVSDTLPTFKRTLNTCVSQGFKDSLLCSLFLSFFLFVDPWRIALTLARKFRVEFIAALYLASNMHEAAFKPLQKKMRKKVFERQ